jgi:lipoprotein-anchoring transpeptidase ErfK/SrfK
MTAAMRPVRISRAMALFASAGFATLIFLPSVACAQGAWVGGGPVFQSDIDRQAQQREAERAEIRRSSAPTAYPAYMNGGAKPDISPEAPPIVYLDQNEQPGTIIVDTNGRKLYYVLSGKRAYAYPISVGRDGFTWTGTERVSRIAAWPSWTPPAEMRQRQQGLPVTVTGGLVNPLGAMALYLGSSIYRIHGTNNERTIGRASSSGCFRLTNQHVVHLATLARVGTTVRVVSSYSGVSPNAPLSSLFSGFGAADDVPAKKTKKN